MYMAQVIRKFNPGGTIADPAPITYNGRKYRLNDAVATWDNNLEKYITHLGLDQKNAATFRQLYGEYVTGLQNGDLSINTNYLTEEYDDSPSYTSNSGKYNNPKKFLGITIKGLTPEQEKDNMSQEVVHYMLASLRNNIVPVYDTNKPKFSIDINKEISDSQYGGKELDSEFFKLWNSYDDVDKATGKRGTTGRAEMLYGILSNTLNRVKNDPSYRRQFSYTGDSTNWDQAWKDEIAKYEQAINLLQDGSIDLADRRELGKLGITGLEKFLSVDDKEIQTALEAEAKKAKEEKMKQNPNGFKARDIFDITSPVQFYWDGELVEDLEKAMEENPDIKTAYQKALQDQFAQQIPDYDWEWKNIRDMGYNFARNLSPYFNLPSNYQGLYSVRQSALDPAGTVYYAQDQDGNFVQGHITEQGGTYQFTPIGGTAVNLGIRRGDVAGKDAVAWSKPEQWNVDYTSQQAMEQYFDTYANRTSKKDIYKLANHIQEWSKLGIPSNNIPTLSYDGQKVVNITKDQNTNKYYIHIYVPRKGTIRYELKDGFKLSTDSQGRKYVTPDQIAAIQVLREGITKAQAGTTITLRTPEQPQQVSEPVEYREIKSSDKPIHASLSSEENNMQEYLAQKELDTNDYIRLGAAMTDVLSAAAAFVPGAHLASAGVGVGSTLAHAVADFSDEDVGFLDALGTATVNLGMDAVSLLPYGKLAKAGKALKVIANYAPHIFGAIQTYNLISDPDLQKSMGVTLHKINNMDISKLNTQDFNNIAYLARTFLGTKGAYKQIKSKIGKGTGKSDIEGEVKIGDKTYKVKAEIDNKDKHFYSTNKKVGKEAIKQSDDLKAKVTQDVEAEFKAKVKDDADFKYTKSDVDAEVQKRIAAVDDIKVRTILGKLDTTRQARVHSDDVYTPKKLFQDTWFSDKGFDWKYSDYNLARSQSPFVQKFTKQFEDVVPYSEKRKLVEQRDSWKQSQQARQQKEVKTKAQTEAKAKAKESRFVEAYGNGILAKLGINETFKNGTVTQLHRAIRLSKNLTKQQKSALLNTNKMRKDLSLEVRRIDSELRKMLNTSTNKKAPKKSEGGLLVQYFQNEGVIHNNITHSKKAPSWKDVVFLYWDNILKGLADAPNKEEFVKKLNETQKVHAELYKKYSESDKEKASFDEAVRNYQQRINTYYPYVNNLGISNAVKSGRYTTKAKKSTSGDNEAKGWTADGLLGAQTADRVVLGMKGDFTDEEIATMNKQLAEYGYEMGLGDTDNHYRLQPKAAPAPSTQTTPVTQTTPAEQTTPTPAPVTQPVSTDQTQDINDKIAETMNMDQFNYTGAEGTGKGKGKGKDKDSKGKGKGVVDIPEGSKEDDENNNGGSWKVNVPTVLGALDLTNSIVGSYATEKAAKEAVKTAQIQAPRHDKRVDNGYPTKKEYEQKAAEYSQYFNIPLTSDHRIHLGSQHSAAEAARKAIQQGALTSAQRYYTTQELVDQQAAKNKEVEISTANTNSQMTAAAESAKGNIKTQAIADRVKSLGNFIKEARTQALQNAAQQNALNTKLAINRYKTDYTNKYLEIRDRYNKEWNNLPEGERNKYTSLDDYIQSDTERYKKFNKEMSDMQSNLYTTHIGGLNKQLSMFSPIYYEENLFDDDSNIWNKLTGVKTEKRGGKLTASEKAKIQKIKDFNAARRTEVKESMKSIRDAQKNFNKMSQTMAAGTLKLMELALGK